MANNDVFWTSENHIIKDCFLEFKREDYPNFKFSFDWSSFPQIEDYLMRLMYNSYSNSSQVRNQLPDLIHDVESFFASGLESGLFNNNLSRIIDNLKDSKDGFRIVEFLPPELSGVFGNSTGNKVQINQQMMRPGNSPSLTANEIRKLYMFHEMGHKILKILSQETVIKKYKDSLNSVLRSKGI